jgi:hypothetical protein
MASIAEASEGDLPTDVRKLQAKLTQARDDARSYKQHLTHAENELAAAYTKIELYEATSDIEFSGIPKHKSSRNSPATAIIVATDWHSEQMVSKATVNGLNEYNLAIASRRATNLWTKAVYLTESARKMSKIRSCVLAMLGDFITGYIHDELVETNFMSPNKAIFWVADHLGSGLRYLLDNGDFDFIDVPCSVGNHGRTTHKSRIATLVENSYEWIIYNILAREFAGDKRVRFHIPKGYHNYLDVQGHICRFHHGDWLKYGGGVGGLSIPVNKAIGQWNKSIRADLDFFGHWHQFLWFKNWVSCPPLIGYDTFSLSIKAEHEEPAQMFAVVDRDRGLVEVRRIFVESPKRS